MATIRLESIHTVEDLTDLGSFSYVKKSISQQIGFTIKAASWDELYNRLTTVTMIFTSQDKSQAKLSLNQKIQYFDQNKSESFIASSKLEGLDIGLPKSNMKEILHKYKQLAIANG